MVIAISNSSAVLTLPAREAFAAGASSEQDLEQGRIERAFGLLFGEYNNTPLDQLLVQARAGNQASATILEGLPLPSGVKCKADLSSQALLLLWDAIEERGWQPLIEQRATPSAINPNFLVIQSRLVARRPQDLNNSTTAD